MSLLQLQLDYCGTEVPLLIIPQSHLFANQSLTFDGWLGWAGWAGRLVSGRLFWARVVEKCERLSTATCWVSKVRYLSALAHAAPPASPQA